MNRAAHAANAVSRRRCLRQGVAWTAAALGLGAAVRAQGAGVADAASAAAGGALARIRTRGLLSVALYDDNPPFSAAGRGIDVELAQALAAALGVGLSPLVFPAGESMGDDLRNMVWRGHYLGYGPADLMLHVPVDRPLIAAQPQVRIFGGYYREQVAWARPRRPGDDGATLQGLGAARIAVPGQSLAGWLLIGAEGGRLRNQLTTTHRDGTQAAAALARGEADVAAGQWSELESVLGRDERFVVEGLPLPQAQRGWAVGCAVRREAEDLAQAVESALATLAQQGRLREIFAHGGVRWRPA